MKIVDSLYEFIPLRQLTELRHKFSLEEKTLKTEKKVLE